MEGLERGALLGRGPALPGLKVIGIRTGTFTFLIGVVVVGLGCGAEEGGRGGDEVGVDSVACEVVGGGDGPGVVDVVWGSCPVPVEDSWFWVIEVPGDNLRKAARAAASRGVEGVPWSCASGRSPSGGAR